MSVLSRKKAGILLAMWASGVVMVGLHWVLGGWQARGDELDVGPNPLRPEVWSAFDSPVESLLSPVGLVLLSAGAFLGARMFAGDLGRKVAGAAAWTLVLLAVVHLAEGTLVYAATVGAHPAGARFWLQGTAFLGYALLVPAGLVASLGAATTVARLWAGRGVTEAGQPPLPEKAAPDPTTTAAHWRANYEVPASRRHGGLGICLSGGGIRSATFCMGALQALQAPPDDRTPARTCELSRARYLTAVSGGAYTAGAYLLSLPHRGDAATARRPTTCTTFVPGSPEYDHVRRHSAYLADGSREWAVAILVLLRGAVLSTLLLALIAMTTGRWAGHLFHQAGRRLTGSLVPEWGAVSATAIVAVLALTLWLLSLVPVRVGTDAADEREARRERWRQRLRNGAGRAGMALAAVVFLGAVVPATAILSARFVRWIGPDSAQVTTTDVARGGAVGTLGLILTVAGLLYRRSTDVAKATRYVIEHTGKLRDRLGDLGRSVAQWLAVYVGLAMVAAVYLLVFGYCAYTTAAVAPSAPVVVRWGRPWWTFPDPLGTSFAVTAGLTVLLLAAYCLVDETAVGLHPFYRRRLASAFAVRRTGDEAQAYPDGEATWLDTHGTVTPAPGEPAFPQVIFCAAAHCSDPDWTPPGRHVLPWSFSHDAIGSPRLGWYSPGQALKLPPRLRGDLTVQAAMAVSGAAFASASGRFHGPANLVLALTNARLGLWLANPRVFGAGHGGKWWFARPPRIRRMSYFVREICGWHPPSNPLLFVSDGARYDTLGLVELLRHRCREIYCFDASSDERTFGHALATSMALAYDELGVRIDLDDPGDARPRPAKPDDGVAEFEGRIAERSVITGRVTYPPLRDGDPDETAVLVIGRAGLDAGTPWEVLRHAAEHPAFPHDATGDQWFDDAKFHAYSALGRHVGAAALDAMEEKRHAAPPAGRYVLVAELRCTSSAGRE